MFNSEKIFYYFRLFILIIIFIASLALLAYRVGTDIKTKKDEIKEEIRKEKEKAEKEAQEIKDEIKKNLIYSLTNNNDIRHAKYQ